jgi:hypothetical protein
MDQSVITHRRNVQAIPSPEETVPAGLLHRRDDVIRYTRGGPVYATDGLVGHLRHVVVEEETGKVSEFIMDLRDGRSVILPVDLVDHGVGSALFLESTRARFAETATNAPTFEKQGFLKANLKKVLSASLASEREEPRRSVNRIGDDFVETTARPSPARASSVPSDADQPQIR